MSNEQQEQTTQPRKARKPLVSDVTIHNDVPMPEKYQTLAPGRAIYQFASLTAYGQSFSYPVIRNKKAAQESSLRAAIGAYRKKHPGTDFIYDIRDDRWFVWRSDKTAGGLARPAEDEAEAIVGGEVKAPAEGGPGGVSGLGDHEVPDEVPAGDPHGEPEGAVQESDATA